ncbi:S41 family peptidase [Winogradskyella alexanderae]|jgi:carboxyl-terminal processing protease|uniref:Peptidase S41 n=1 Tax=Winogradskyella alexanderae TaxID=2877123 RepID=A0ABS7XS75_9FLAO|nr:S41 family peptidase [Winogradskyella alexanderae]MCA0132234.1 peptidase S41 [Winogradskyella alexanderae]
MMKNSMNFHNYLLSKRIVIKKIKILLLGCFALFTVTACFEDLDDNAINASEITDFIWKGMNATYLYKSEIPDLADDRFASDEEYVDYLNDFESPDDIFFSLLFDPVNVDKFSRLFANYFDLQNLLQGNTITNGLEFNLYFVPGSSTEVFGAITLVLNNSTADSEGLRRGMIFRSIDGQDLNTNNINTLLGQTSYTLNFADYDDNGTAEAADDTIIPNGSSTTLTKVNYVENPVHLTEILEVDNTTIGYLVYNGFNSNFNEELNDAFGTLQNANIDELVIDLRYNGGGSVQTATYLGSMITGQFNGAVYSQLKYNDNLSSLNRDYLFTNAFEGGGLLNNLNLSKVYVLTTNRRTASASELLINSLRPYIDVVVIGENTAGKTQASVTVYDSPTLFSTEGINPNHTFAIQPLVANSSNVNDQLVPSNGIAPDFLVSEFPGNLGVLGNTDEPLLAEAIFQITGTMGRSLEQFSLSYETPREVDMSKLIHPLEQEMYIE